MSVKTLSVSTGGFGGAELASGLIVWNWLVAFCERAAMTGRLLPAAAARETDENEAATVGVRRDSLEETTPRRQARPSINIVV